MVNFSCESKNNSPIVLQATYNDFIFNFRADNTYELILSFLSSEEGKYKIKDSIITLDVSKIRHVIKSPYLKIAAENPSYVDTRFHYLLQVNDRNEFIDSSIIFIISEDNRR